MIIMDSTVLMLFFHPNVDAPLDETTGKPLTRCKERIDFLLQNLSQAKIQVMVTTPVLSEILICSGVEKERVLREINTSYAFKIQPFDEMAAIEVAMLTDADLQSNKKLTPTETKAKVKYDRQIIAIAKVAGIKTIYSDDGNLCTKAKANGIESIRLCELPLPPDPPQGCLLFPSPESPVGEPNRRFRSMNKVGTNEKTDAI